MTAKKSYADAMQPLLPSVLELEKQIAGALAQVFFSTDVRLGRALLVIVAAFAPRAAAAGIAGILLCLVTGRQLSQNRQIQESSLVALNGWYLGLACATFLPNARVLAMAMLGLSPVCVLLSLAMGPLLRTWDLPLVVLPYVVTVWQAQILGFYNPALAFVADSSNLATSVDVPVAIALGTLKSFGQIFFQESAAFSAAVLALLAVLLGRRVWLMLVAAFVATTIAHLVLGQHWLLGSGLTGFGAALLIAASQERFVALTHRQQLLLTCIAGVLEVVAVHLAGTVHLFALSSSYIAILWLGRLISESRSSSQQDSIVSMPW